MNNFLVCKPAWISVKLIEKENTIFTPIILFPKDAVLCDTRIERNEVTHKKQYDFAVQNKGHLWCCVAVTIVHCTSAKAAEYFFAWHFCTMKMQWWHNVTPGLPLEHSTEAAQVTYWRKETYTKIYSLSESSLPHKYF